MTAGLLLDTHVLLWMLTEPARLSRRVHDLVVDRSNLLFASAASAWEIATKHRLGKLPQADALVRGYETHLARLGIGSIQVTAGHGLLAGSMSWPHRDPFDRMIAAQCMLESMPLATADDSFRDLPGVEVIW